VAALVVRLSSASGEIIDGEIMETGNRTQHFGTCAGKRLGAVWVCFALLTLASKVLALETNEVDALNKQVATLYKEGKYIQAVPLATNALHTAESSLGPEHPTTATALDNLGDLYRKLANYDEAESIYQRCLRIREKVLGQDHQETAKTLRSVGELFRTKGDYAKAEPILRRALSIDEKILGPEDAETAASSDFLGQLYVAQEQYAKAEALLERALKIREHVLGQESQETAETLNHLGDLYRSRLEFAKAEPLFQRALKINEKILDPEHPEMSSSLNYLGMLGRAKGDYVKAQSLLQRALAIREKVYGSEHPATATVVQNLALLYVDKADYPAAEPLYQRALRVTEKSLGPDHRSTAIVLGNLGKLYLILGNYAKAEPLLQRSLNIREKIYGRESPQIAAALNNLAELYQSKGDFVQAEALCRRAVSIYEHTLGQDNPGTGSSLNRLASLYAVKGDYTNAEAMYWKASGIFEKVYGPEHPTTAGNLDNLSRFCQGMGDFKKAEELSERALKIREKVFGAEHPATASSLEMLGNLYTVMGDFAKAEPMDQRALRIREKAFGPDHPVVASSLLALAGLYGRMRDYPKVLSLSERALRIYEQSCGPTHPSTGSALRNLAGFYMMLGDVSKAEPLFQRALSIAQQVYGPEHPVTADSLNNLAHLYLVATNYAKAEPLYLQALSVYERSLGREHPSVAETLNGLARLYLRAGEYAKAEPLYERALQIREKVLGAEHPITAATLDELGFVFLELRKETKALEVADKAARGNLKTLANVLSFASEQERLRYQARCNPYSLFASLSDGPRMAQAILRNKGIVLDSLLEDRLMIEASENPEDRSVTEQLEAAKQRLTQLLLEVPKDLSQQGLKDRAEARRRAFEDVEHLEGILARKLTGLGHARRGLSVTVESVQAAIPTDAALVEFVAYGHYLGKNQWERRYGAAILGRRGEAKWVSLGAAANIETNIMAYQVAIRRRTDEARLSLALKDLYQQIWAPLEVELPPGVKTVIASPDAALNFVSFATLLTPEGQFVGQNYSIHYVASGRDLLGEAGSSMNTDMVVFANPLYSKLGMTKAETPGVFLSPLPGSAKQAAALETKANEWSWPVHVYLGAAATEAQLRAISSPRILHFATHGFFLPETVGGGGILASNRGPAAYFGEDSGSSSQVMLENPMYRSALALAGAQDTLEAWKRGEAPPTGDDGIVNAEEVGGLHLQGTWLVALSACDTGIGEIMAGEGVMGLRRGFVQAGARHLLMTLWPVAVDETGRFMVDFYSALQKSRNAPEALAVTQRDWLVNVRKLHGLLPAVFLAGAFILSSQGPPE
jgi:tetratricopeptide (TPR) repeat protein